MKHYIPLQSEDGRWMVAYENHRGEFVAVMDCGSLSAAYREAAAMTAKAWGEHVQVMGAALNLPVRGVPA